ncbi:MAG: hypothetical protein ACOYLB_09585 [Phototrophicaceae bacterium]
MQGTLNEQSLGLIDAIRTAGGITVYVSRQAIARSMGKPRLSASDTAVLDLLASLGYIEREERTTSAPSGYKIVYRVSDKHMQLVQQKIQQAS